MTGKTISHYRIVEKIGEGGMGEVYLAEDLRLSRKVALKLLPSHLTANRDARARFENEARAAATLNHPNIVTIYEIGEHEGRVFISMEYVPGETLRARMAAKALSEAEVLEISLQICEGLRKAHQAGIVHRDIKPENLLIDADGRVRILDFGLAKLKGVSSITSDSSTLGTILYMSPEQARGEPVDQRTDIWSFGVVVYEMLTGQMPFRGEYEQAVIYSILNEEPEPIRDRNPGVSPALEQVVSKALAKSLAERYQRVDEILGVFSSRRQPFKPGGRAVAAKTPRSGRRLVLVASMAAVLIIAVLVGVLMRGEDSPSEISSSIDSLKLVAEQGRLNDAYDYLLAAAVDLEDPRLRDVVDRIAGTLTISTDPPGATVTATRALPPASFASRSTLDLGQTPVVGRRLVAGEYLVRLSLPGFNPIETLMQVEVGRDASLARNLIEDTEESTAMVLVHEGESPDGRIVSAFAIDRTEVTHAQYFRFVADGGYRNPTYWPDTLALDGQPLEWSAAMSRFVDRTGLPGPRFWSSGGYPGGKAEHPVVGVSWYEAAAYARWSGKQLPSWDQWWRAALGDSERIFPWGGDVKSIDYRANFALAGARPVASFPLGVSPFGCYDMAGNVREWLRDPVPGADQRQVVGGSWQDPVYMFEPSHVESFDPGFASKALGFRCVGSMSKGDE